MSTQSRDKKYKRILLKLSGEALMGQLGFGIDPKVLDRMGNVEELIAQVKDFDMTYDRQRAADTL